MTTEDRYIIDLTDIQEIRFECTQCGAAISFKAAAWEKCPPQCPACAVSWHHGEPTPEFQNLNRLLVALRALTDNTKRSYKLRMVLDRPSV